MKMIFVGIYPKLLPLPQTIKMADMKRLNTIALLFALLISFQTFAQKEDYVWVCGPSRIDFNTDPPTVSYNGDFNYSPNLSDVCDYNGELIYWINGDKLYNKNNEVIYEMKGFNFSYMSECLPIIPFPNSKDKYIFSCFKWNDIYFYVIDGTEDALHPTIYEYDRLSFSYWSGCCMPVQKKNSRDFWLLFDDLENIKIYSFTEDGLHPHYVYTKPYFDTDIYGTNDVGNYSVSPDNSIILGRVVSFENENLYFNIAFDNELGFIKELYPTFAKWDMIYPFVFSSQAKYLYFTIWDKGVVGHLNPDSKNEENQNIYRCPVDKLLEENSLMKYRELVYTCTSGSVGSMKLAPDGNIYLFLEGQDDYLGVIKKSEGEHPEVEEQGFKLYAQSQHPGNYAASFPHTYHFPYNISYNKKCDYVEFSFSDNYKAKSFLWDFGDGSETSSQQNPSHTYPEGNFKAQLTVEYDGKPTQNYSLDVKIQKPKAPKIVCE